MRKKIQTVKGEWVEFDIVERVSWKQMCAILKGNITFDEAGRQKIDFVPLLDKALRVMASPVVQNGHKLNVDIFDGPAILKIVSEDIIPLLFLDEATKSDFAGKNSEVPERPNRDSPS